RKPRRARARSARARPRARSPSASHDASHDLLPPTNHRLAPFVGPVEATARPGPDAFRAAMAARVLVADGAMGTMLQSAAPTLDDFQGLEGCNEILNVSRPDIVRSVHD